MNLSKKELMIIRMCVSFVRNEMDFGGVEEDWMDDDCFEVMGELIEKAREEELKND